MTTARLIVALAALCLLRACATAPSTEAADPGEPINRRTEYARHA